MMYKNIKLFIDALYNFIGVIHAPVTEGYEEMLQERLKY